MNLHAYKSKIPACYTLLRMAANLVTENKRAMQIRVYFVDYSCPNPNPNPNPKPKPSLECPMYHLDCFGPIKRNKKENIDCISA
jgi:hypothetical protein